MWSSLLTSPSSAHREEFIAPIPEAERGDIVLAYHPQLNSEDDETRLRAARAWTKWEMWTSKLHVDPKQVAEADDSEWSKYACLLRRAFE